MYDCHVWTNVRVDVICFLFGQYLIPGTILFISRSYWVSGVRLIVINARSTC
jgi:hypothetical protein